MKKIYFFRFPLVALVSLGVVYLGSLGCSGPASTFPVGGSVLGLDGSLVLQNNGEDDLTLTSDGDFTFDTFLAEGALYDVTVAAQPDGQTCTVSRGSGTMGNSDVTNVRVTCEDNDESLTTLSADATGIIAVGGEGGLTVTNTGTVEALNVQALLPAEWADVMQDSSDCAVVLPGETCTLLFSANSPHVAQENIEITGDNISSSPTTNLAFSLGGYLVVSVPFPFVALVVANSDANPPLGIVWSVTNNNIAGITETSTNPPDLCNGATEGACNTGELANQYGAPYTDFAAGLCYDIVSDDYSGPVANGTWFLPAICQLHPDSGGSGCAADTPNIFSNLFELGFLQDLGTGGSSDSPGNYWSSTESAADPTNDGWVQNFGGENNSFTAPKAFELGVRCVRLISLI